MKRYLCALLALALLCGAALAEAEEAPVEITAVVEAEEASPEESEAPEEGAEEPEETPGAEEAEAEPTVEPATVRIGFEDGFALELPEGWLYHPVTEKMAEQGVVYCLSDAAGAGWLYIQSWSTECADMEALKELIDTTADIQSSGIYAFNGTDFVVYDMQEGDVSCCAALLDGQVLNLVFTPQSDADFMAVAAWILSTFEIL